MYSEIGSEFWSGCSNEDGTGIYEYLPYRENVILTLSGRTALDLIIKDIKSKNEKQLAVYMPAYCCHSMIQPFNDNGIEVKFYDVDFVNGRFTLDISSEDNSDIFFAMEYFGYHIDGFESNLQEQRNKGKIIIQDTTHSLFEKSSEHADYYFASIRKWFNVNAGYVSKNSLWSTKNELTSENTFSALRNDAFTLKKKYMEGEEIDKDKFLSEFGRAEEVVDKDYRNYRPDAASFETLERINTKELILRRRNNAKALIAELTSEKFKDVVATVDGINNDEVPLFVPIFVQERRDELRRHLVANNIYLPVHWAEYDETSCPANAKKMYKTELSVVCDQRYDERDMFRIVECIKSYLK